MNNKTHAGETPTQHPHHSEHSENHHHYVVLSDLHLGAKYSILHEKEAEKSKENIGQSKTDQSKTDQSKIDQSKTDKRPSALREFIACMRAYVPKVFGKEKPKLILLGDVLDYDFASPENIKQDFKMLMDEFFPKGEEDLWIFQEDVIYIPGNHDHVVWKAEQKHFYIDNLYGGENQPTRMASTHLFREKPLYSCYLNSLAHEKNCYGELPDGVKINLRYPNFGLTKADRAVYLHHGHYIEPLYRVMTTLFGQIENATGITVEQLERDNGSWINFLWSGLGASSDNRKGIIKLYEIMQNPAATHRYAKLFADWIGQYLKEHYFVDITKPIFKDMSLEKFLVAFLDSTLGRNFQLERASFHQALTEDSIGGLRWYLSKPLKRQIMEDTNPKQTFCEAPNNPSYLHEETGKTHSTFIFGHSHKPFESALAVEGYDYPVNIYNTGGWTVDTPNFTLAQGAAAVFISKELDVASLRLYQAPFNEQCSDTHVEVVNPLETTPLQKNMMSSLEETKPLWKAFSEKVKEAMEFRAKEVREKFFDPKKELGRDMEKAYDK